MDGITTVWSWKPVVILLYDIRMWSWFCVPTRGAFLQFEIHSYDPIGKSILFPSDTTPVASLNQLYAIKFIQSPYVMVRTFIYWHKKGGLSTPCVLLKKYLDVTPLGVMNSSVAEKCKHLIWIVDFWIKFRH